MRCDGRHADPATPEIRGKGAAMSAHSEPTAATLTHPLARYCAATRPAFLTVTAVGVLLGMASVVGSGGSLDPLRAAVALLLALCAHAAANVLNDYYDALSGTDALNVDRLYPFTGGSRLIQNQVLTPAATRRFAHALLALVIIAGLWLAAVCGAGLLLVGLAGLLIGWAYSVPPLKLQSRGLGELAIIAGWLLVVVGSDYVQRGAFAFAPLASGLAFALLVANVLYINQFPDVKADAACGKRTLVVRLGVLTARWGYLLLALSAYGWMIVMLWLGRLPLKTWPALLPVVASFIAARHLWRAASQVDRLRPAIQMTIAAANIHGLLLSLLLLS